MKNNLVLSVNCFRVLTKNSFGNIYEKITARKIWFNTDHLGFVLKKDLKINYSYNGLLMSMICF